MVRMNYRSVNKTKLFFVFFLFCPVTLFANKAEPFFTKGYALYNQKKYDSALIQFKKGLTYDKSDYLIYQTIGHIYRFQKKGAASIPFYLKAIELKPDDANLHAVLALSYGEVKKTQERIKHLSKAIAISKKNGTKIESWWLINLGYALSSQKQYAKAIDNFLEV